MDADGEAIAYAHQHYAHPRAAFVEGYAQRLGLGTARFEAVVCFETLEHIQDPLPLLKSLRGLAPMLLASVPNELEFPYQNYAFHYRHYTPGEFEELLESAGWRVVEWHGQQGPESEVERGSTGRTVIAICEAGDFTLPVTDGIASVSVPPSPAGHTAPPPPVPKHVAILGMGPSLSVYLDLVRGLGARHKAADEVWTINALGDIFLSDRVFHMDDVRIQQLRADARPESNIANMLPWLKRHPGPVYTSQPHPDYPGLVAYPLEDVVNFTRYGYFNSTAAYAVALAIFLGVKKLSIYGCDYTYPDAHDAEKGRGCLEFWLGYAAAKGIKLSVPAATTLLDAREPPDKRYYGYDMVDIHREADPTGRMRFSFRPREIVPTADEIEAAYDHSKHPNSLVSGDEQAAPT